MKKQLTKSATASDAHWGARGNSEQHNQDCLRFFEWFCTTIKSDPSITHINFLGDWFENRSAINIETLNYAYQGAKLLNDLNLPVFFVVGNHDLYNRNTRNTHSIAPYAEFSNFIIIDEPTIVDYVDGGALYCPHLFHDEYPSLVEYLTLDTWWGHFEFQGFRVTGSGTKMLTGPDPTNFTGPKHIFSGHFHARQQDKNITYVGNIFPTNFSDAGDNKRGMMVYDHTKSKISFHDWAECPMFIKTTLSAILDGTVTIPNGARMKCVVDVPITFEESMTIRQQFIDTYNLREFVLEESSEIDETLTTEDDELSDIPDVDLKSVDELVIYMLSNIESEHFDNKILIEQYNRLSTDYIEDVHPLIDKILNIQ